MERLQKVIAASGYTSRRKAEELIKTGHVMVNDKLITELGTKVDSNDIVSIDGTILNKDVKFEYYLLNKPRGVISSVSDAKGRPTVVDLIASSRRIYPIGRLDYNTTGLILLTNDGKFANHLMHPSFQIEKTYVAKLEGIISGEDIANLKKGLIIEGRKVEVKRFKLKKKDLEKNTSLVEVTIVEGRNHIIKKLFEKLNLPVNKLSRIGYGFLTLDNLKSGEYRQLTIKEVKKFYNL